MIGRISAPPAPMLAGEIRMRVIRELPAPGCEGICFGRIAGMLIVSENPGLSNQLSCK